MRTVLFLFLNLTQRTICSASFQMQQSFGVILYLGLCLFGKRGETQLGFRCPTPVEKHGAALLTLSAGWSPLCHWLLSGAVDIEEPSGAARSVHGSACPPWTLQPGLVTL